MSEMQRHQTFPYAKHLAESTQIYAYRNKHRTCTVALRKHSKYVHRISTEVGRFEYCEFIYYCQIILLVLSQNDKTNQHWVRRNGTL